MANLEQELRQFDKPKFEIFVHQYLLAKYPGADIKQAEGSGGDRGVDCFEGTLSSGAAIWQFKHFPDRIRKTQREQIRESIATAFKEPKPSLWTLCVPINLRTDEHSWFQNEIVAKYGGPERIKLVQASDFLKELQHNRSLRDMFFPDSAQSEMLKVRAALTQTEDLSKEQLDAIATEYAQQYLETDMALDPRLDAVISIGGSPLQRQPAKAAGLVMSITKGSKTTSFYARDPKAFNLDPLNFKISVGKDAQVAFQTALDSGRSVTLKAGSILNLTSPSPLLKATFEGYDLNKMELQLVPQLPSELTNKFVPLRLKAGTGTTAQTLACVPFKVTRAGGRELELTSAGAIPAEFKLTLSLLPDGQSGFNIKPNFPDADARQVQRFVAFLDELQRSGEFAVDSVEFDKPLLKASGKLKIAGQFASKGFREILSKAVAVSEAFNTPLLLRTDPSDSEFDGLEMLYRIASGVPISKFEFNAELVKSSTDSGPVTQILEQPSFPIMLEHPNTGDFEVFGATINAGPIRVTCDKCTLANREKVREAYQKAKEGEIISVHFTGESAKFVRISHADLLPETNEPEEITQS